MIQSSASIVLHFITIMMCILLVYGKFLEISFIEMQIKASREVAPMAADMIAYNPVQNPSR